MTIIDSYTASDRLKPDETQIHDWVRDVHGFFRVHHSHMQGRAVDTAGQLSQRGAAWVALTPGDSTQYGAAVIDKQHLGQDHRGYDRFVCSFSMGDQAGSATWGMEAPPYQPTDSVIATMCGNGHTVHHATVAWIYTAYLCQTLNNNPLPWMKP